MVYSINEAPNEDSETYFTKKKVRTVFPNQESCIRCGATAEKVWTNWWCTQQKAMKNECLGLVKKLGGEQ